MTIPDAARRFVQMSVAMIAMLAPCARAANNYVQHNLVSDVPGQADQTDPNLINPWGIAASSTSPFWISNNHSGTATSYNSTGQPFPPNTPLVVTVPAPPNVAPPSAPTGQVFNGTTGFNVADGKPALFIFATEGGTISGWSPSTNAVVLVDNSQAGAVYKGLALAETGSGPMLYAANFNAGTIDVFEATATQIASPGGFIDPNLPAGFAPFNIQRIGHKLFVTYAMQNDAKHDDVAGSGNGFVDVFDFAGNLTNRLILNGNLNSPWGLAVAPDNFGDFSNALLVGNFGDGTINAYDPCSGDYLGSLNDAHGQPISIPGLWALKFGNGHTGGDANILYFTAGIPSGGAVEDHGLFGSIQTADSVPAPQPQTAAIAISNFAFAPTPITVTAGTQVTWTNDDGIAHTVVADDVSFKSGILEQNGTFSQTLTSPGTRSYHCSIHPFMKGVLVVQ